MTTVSSADLETELSKARAHLARLQTRSEGASDQTSARDNYNTSNNHSAAAKLFLRAREVEDQIEFLSLNRHVVKLVSDIQQQHQGNNAEAAAGDTSLIKATETCTALGLLLFQHTKQHEDGNSSPGKSGQLYNALLQWYNSLYNSTRNSACTVFQTQLRKVAPEYPSNERSSNLIAEAFLLLSPAVPSPPSQHDESLNLAAKCLVELQVVHDAVQLQQEVMQQSDGNPSQQHQQQQLSQLPSSWRLDIVDELCKPLAERLRFHFLEEQSGIIAGDNPEGQNNKTTGNNHQASSKMDRLPEWLFRYLREVVDNHGVHSLVMVGGVSPLVDSVIDSLMVRASMMISDKCDGDERGDYFDNTEEIYAYETTITATTTTTAGSMKTLELTMQHLKCQYYNHSSTYFLREVARMARHTLRAKSFFHHPDVVGSECCDRTIALRGIEQLFLFDSFVGERVKQEGGGGDEGYCHDGGVINSNIFPPRMVDTFLSSNESLLLWWLEEENDDTTSTLHQCALATLSSYKSQNEEGTGAAGGSASAEKVAADDSSSTTQQQEQLYPPISELFVALLHSARCKSNIFTDHRSRQMYIANVIAPLCSEYSDMVHAQAAWLRKHLLARHTPTTSSSAAVSSVSVLSRSSANLPSDELLVSNTMEWTSLITGTHLAAQAVLLHPMASNNGQQQQPFLQHDEEQHDSHVLDRVGESMERLCNAMVEEYVCALVETIIMERAKLASYMMRAPFLLSEPHDSSSPEDRRGQRDKDTSVGNSNLSLSPDLNDSIHVMSVGVHACNATMVKLGSMFQSDDDNCGGGANNIEGNQSLSSTSKKTSTMLYHGCSSVHKALKFAIGQKLLDIAIDPQGMTPEISLGGARQFQHDVVAFEFLFRAVVSDGDSRVERVATHYVVEPGPMERAVTASHLMSLESCQIQAIREALRALVVPSGSIGSLFVKRTGETAGEFGDGENSRLNVDDFYRDERLMEESINMLEAKGFGALSLDEALSIINRRC